MKKMHHLLPLLALLLCCWSTPSFAQQEAEESNKIIIIKKSVDENGVQIIEKIVKDGNDDRALIWSELGDENTFEYDLDMGDLHRDLEEIQRDLEDNFANMNIDINSENGEDVIHLRMDGEDGLKTFKWKGNSADMEELKDAMKQLKSEFHNGENGNLFLNFDNDHHFNSCDNNTKPFLGVVMEQMEENNDGIETREGTTSQGVIIQRVVSGSAAEAAGLQKGDIITAIDGNTTTSINSVSKAIKAKKVGDAIRINYLRNGSNMSSSATLKAKEVSSYGSQNWEHFKDKDFDFDFDFDFDYDDHSFRRDPCKVFIGVYTSTSRNESGVRVSSVIDETPAFEAGLLKGDVITALDGISVNSHQSLLTERNKHEQADEFTISYTRDGENYTVDARFKSCKEEESKENGTDDRTNMNVSPDTKPTYQLSNNLDIDLNAFPNPTNGPLNIRFNGEETATTVTVTDINGKEIYREEISDFDGYYDKKVSLNGAALGPVIISVRQGKMLSSAKIMYIQGRA